MKRHSFTLVELLVVIAIIAILAGMLMPALNIAQAQARKTQCTANQKQLMSGMMLYSKDYESMMVVASNGNNYIKILTGRAGAAADTDVTSQQYIPYALTQCPVVAKKHTDSDVQSNVALTFQGTGMFDATGITGALLTTLGRCRIGALSNSLAAGSIAATDNMAYLTERIKSPANTIMFADTYTEAGGEDTQFWSFRPTGSGLANTRVATVHRGDTVVAFGDGRAEAIRGKELNKSINNGITAYYDSDMTAQTNP